MNIGDNVIYVNGGDIADMFIGYKRTAWVVTDISERTIHLVNILDNNRSFTTDIRNLIPISEVEKLGKLDPKYLRADILDLLLENSKSKGKFMSEEKSMIERTMKSNTAAAKVAATVTAGNTLNRVVAKKISPQLPMLARGYADSAMGRVVIANVADFGVKQFMPGNAKALLATEAMMQAALLELLGSFDIEGMVEEVLNSVSLDIPNEE